MKRRILSFLLSVVAVIGLFPTISIAADPTYGTCGDSINWYLQNDGTLLLDGSGETYDYGPFLFNEPAPWNSLVNQITSIEVQGNITKLGSYLFSDCINAVGIVLPASLEYIDPSAMPDTFQFYITEDNSVNYVAYEGVLYGKNVDPSGQPLEDGEQGQYCLVRYPSKAVYTSYQLRDETEAISSGAFSHADKLQHVILNDGLEVISNDAFSWCTSLQSLEIPFGVTKLGTLAFEGCTSLSSLTLPSSITEIDTSAFWGCESLQYIEIPSSVNKIGCDASAPDGAMVELNWNQNYYFLGDAPSEFSVKSGLTTPLDDGMGYQFVYVRSDIYYPENANGWDKLIQDVGESEWIHFYPYSREEDDRELTFTVDRSTVTVVEGDTAYPRVNLSPSNAKVVWTSSNENVAKVDSGGTVTGVGVGTAWITGIAAYGQQEKSATYMIRVTSGLEIALTNKSVNLNVGDTERIGFTVRPVGQVVRAVSSNPSVVEIKSTSTSGKGSGSVSIHAVASGTVTLTIVTQRRGTTVTDTCTVIVEDNSQAVAQRFVDKALTYVGMGEAEFEKSTGYSVPNKKWCAAFVSVCAQLTGVQNAIPYNIGAGSICKAISDFGGTEFCFDINDRKGSFSNAIVVNRETFEPHIGDIVAIRKGASGISHCGIVYDVDNTHIYIVHGNWGKRVAKTAFARYYYNTSPTHMIVGYARPNWAAASGIISGKTSDELHCPVDIQVSYNGEVLDSATGQLTASFGTMAVSGDGGDQNISLQMNDYYSEAETWINGTGTGSMTFVTTSEDEDGTIGIRTFTDVPVTSDTLIHVVRSNFAMGAVVLEVYNNDKNTLKEVWYADSDTPSVNSLNKELTQWYLYGDTEEVDDGSNENTESPSTGESSYSPVIQVTSGGTVKVDPKSPNKGDKVTIIPNPDQNYEVDSVTVTDKAGDKVAVTANRDGTYTFEQPASRVRIEVTFREIVDELLSFRDVLSTAWYYDAVKYVVENGIMSGTGTYTFEPNTTLSRGMIAQMLYALEGKPNVTEAGYFNDVPVNAWFAKAAAWAQSKGIITGYDNGNFGPNDPLTREQLALILYNYAKTKGYGTSAAGNLSQFVDGSSTSVWAQEGTTWAVGAGLLSGRDGNMLCPTGTATRAEVAQIMMNFCENVAK